MFQFFQILLASSQLNEVCQSHRALLLLPRPTSTSCSDISNPQGRRWKGQRQETGEGGQTVCVHVCVCVCVSTRLGRGRCAETGLDTDWQIGRGQEDGESTTTTETGEKNRGRQSSTESSLGTLKTVAVTTCDMMPPCLLRAPPLGLAVPG